MEKLQAALEKARTQRGVSADPVRRAGPKSAAAPADRVQTAWEALSPLDLAQDRLAKKRVVALQSGAAATPFDMLRTRIHHMMATNNWRRLVITSPGPGCGKTTLAANLAAGFGRQADLRTILLDLDLRRPALAKLLFRSRTEGPGTEAVLRGEVPFADQARRLGANVAVSCGTGPVKNAAELLQSGGTAEVLDRIEGDYAPSLILFDMPPLFASDDTAGFLDRVDCALIVAEAGRSTVEQIDKSERMLAEGTNVLGVVLNKSRFPEEGHDYGYYDYG